jgi:uncharacterized RDD family membrane protein YckC/tRNA A-37 threonylcarbamoyl transferase component Bud32
MAASVISARFRPPGHDSAVKAEAYETTLLAESGPRATPRPSEASSQRWTGASFDHFTIEKPLARGGMGAVYVAVDRSLDRRVAIKVLPDELAHQPDLQERFVREARAQARLNSPHVAQIYYIGRTPVEKGEPGSLYFAMELVDGGALESVLEAGQTLEPERARRLMLEVARGLKDAVLAGIIHRDIKPSNLLLDKNGSIKIADFGVAKPIGGTDSKITQEGAIVGSPLYMAPEQARGEEVDHRADMYSMGCTFYHLLSGKPPFDGSTPIAVVAKHLTTPAPPLAEGSARLPSKLVTIIERLMAKDAAARFGSYDDLIAALEAAAPESVQHGGFWARGAAVSIDVALVGSAIWLLGWPGLFLHLAYVTLGHALWGQTAGKYLMNLIVRRPNGHRLGMLRSLARTVASMWLPFLVGVVILLTEGRSELKATIERMQPAELDAFQSLLVAIVIGNALLTLLYVGGLLLAAFHPQKRAAHDLVVGSEVVYKLRSKKA